MAPSPAVRISRTARLGMAAARHPRSVVAVWLMLVIISAVLLPLRLGALSVPAADLEDSPALEAATVISRGFPRLGSEQMLLAFDSPDIPATNPAYQKAVSATARALTGRAGVGDVLPVPQVAGQHSRHCYVAIGIRGDAATRQRNLPLLQETAYRAAREASDGRVSVAVVGLTPVLAELVRADLSDLQLVEAVTVPAAGLLLVLGLGTVGAACVPMLVAMPAILTGTGAILALGLLTPVDTTVLTVTTTVGLGLGLDYALLILLRYRQARSDGCSPIEAVGRATATAGTTVSWCALVVIATSSALLTIPVRSVRMLALSAMTAAGVTLCGALTLLPALLPRLDHLLELGRVRHRARTTAASGAEGWWARWARHLMRRPWPYLLAALTALVLTALPALDMHLGLHYDRTAIAHTETGRGLLRMEHDHLASVTVLALPHPPGTPPVETSNLAAALRADPRVALTGALDNGTDLTMLTIGERHPPDSTASAALLNDLRQLAPRLLPPGQQVLIAGPAAALQDLKHTAVTGLWQVTAIVLAGSFILLLLIFRSVLIPLKAIVMNVLALGAAFGVLTLTSGATAPAGQINVLIPPLVLALVFGLSMDYEVFLVHRVAEHYRRCGDNTAAVAHGLQHTARTITLAAAVMVVTFAGLLATHRQDFQQTGLAVTAAIAIDVTLVRVVLVPSLMRLLDHRNWWLPQPLVRLLPGDVSTVSERTDGSAPAIAVPEPQTGSPGENFHDCAKPYS